MDSCEAAQMVFARVRSLEPDNVTRIMGYLLLQDHSNTEMFNLAFCTDPELKSAIAKAKQELMLNNSHNKQQQQQQHLAVQTKLPNGFTPEQQQQPEFSPRMQIQAQERLHRASPRGRFVGKLDIPEHNNGHLHGLGFNMERHSPHAADAHNGHLLHGHGFSKGNLSSRIFHEQQQLHSSPRGMLNDELFYNDPMFLNNVSNRNLSINTSSLNGGACSPDLMSPCKPCLYFSKGHCKHGTSCRFMHNNGNRDCSPSSSAGSGGPWDLQSDEALSLERLDMELQELLRTRRGPISISALPQLYYERFGKTLQADGYLTESQRHGKPGYSLTKLLARLKSTVSLVDRPHGQHAVMLAEDAQKRYKDDLGDVNPSSRQVYLTFPAESTFTEEDVSIHFSAYGPVQDVRIPCQQRRMFGFVTFVYSETVRAILSEGNPHYICGSRVLVKPYREKCKLTERKPMEKGFQFTDDFLTKDYLQEASSSLIGSDAARRAGEEKEALELQRKLAELHLADSHAKAEAAAALAADMEQNRLLSGFFDPEVVIPQHGPVNERYQTDGFLSATQSARFDLLVSSKQLIDGSLHGGSGIQKLQLDPFNYLVDSGAQNLGDLPFNYAHSLQSPLSEGPFSSPHVQHKQNALMGSLSLAGLPGTSTALSPVSDHDLTCCICFEYFVDPIQLECSHTFCVQCILKVVKASKDECPICRRNIGSQIYKLLQKRDLQSWLSSAENHMIMQSIW